jgi:hypothetical protein
MLKCLPIIVALIASGAGAAKAQEREAIFQRVVVPGANYEMVLAVAKPGGAIASYRHEFDPNVIYLGNGLVASYTTELSKMLDLATLLQPALSYAPKTGDKDERAPILVYFVPLQLGTTSAAMR